MDATLALGLAAVADVVTGAAFAYAGARTLQRGYSSEARPAGRLLAAWWLGLAATAGVSTLLNLAALAWPERVGLLDALDQASLAVFAASLVAFAGYLSYLLAGTYRPLLAVAPFYAGIVAFNVWNVVQHPATGHRIEAWRPILVREDGGSLPPALTASLLLLPILVGLVTYLVLLGRTSDAPTKRRLRLIAMSLATWIASVALVASPGLSGNDAVQVLGRAGILASAAALYAAYHPSAYRDSPDAPR